MTLVLAGCATSKPIDYGAVSPGWCTKHPHAAPCVHNGQPW
jgi:hypothetical protein